MNNEITIIVPIYNSSRTLLKLFTSIESQVYKKFKVILIDGSSTDDSLSICVKQSKKDDRFSVIKSKYYSEQHDVATLRNIGLENVNTSYVTFIDSDDWVEKNHLSNLLNYIKGTELSVCGWTNEDTGIYNLKNNAKILDKDELLVKTLGMKESAGYTCNKLFLTEIIKNNNLKFDSRYKVSEDLLFCIEYIKKINCGTIIRPAKTYHYIKRKESITSSIYTKKPFTELETIEAILPLINTCSIKVKKAYLIHKLMAYNSIFRIANNVSLSSGFIVGARKDIKKNIFLLSSSKEYPLRNKIALIGYAFVPGIIEKCRELKRKFL